MFKVKAIKANNRSGNFFIWYLLQETCQSELLIRTNIVFVVVSWGEKSINHGSRWAVRKLSTKAICYGY